MGEDGLSLSKKNARFCSGQAWKIVPDCPSIPQDTNITGSKVSAEVKSTNYTITSSFSLYILQLVTSVLASAAPSHNVPVQTKIKIKIPIIG